MNILKDSKEAKYLNSIIIAFNYFDEIIKKNFFIGYLYRNTSKNQPLILHECNDGSKFTSMNQVINEAKYIVNYLKD